MAIIKEGCKLSGRVGDLIYRQTKSGTVVYQAPVRSSKQRATKQQMLTRIPITNLGANYSLYGYLLEQAFEYKKPHQSDYNCFVQMNHGHSPVYLTKSEKHYGSCVLAPYVISRGTLKIIAHRLTEEGVLVTDISLGSLVIDEHTTVADFSEAILANNGQWKEGDQLSFLHAVQWLDKENYPRVDKDASKILLDTSDLASATRLYDMVSPKGFSSVKVETPKHTKKSAQYLLGMSEPLTESGAVYVHSRHLSNGRCCISTQAFVVVSTILADYQSEEAFLRAAESYGCTF